jgi:Na+/H+-translocating membrane pyrophosphatase
MQEFVGLALFQLSLGYIVVESWFGNPHHLADFIDRVLAVIV